MALSSNIRQAIKCGPIPKLKTAEQIAANPVTQGEMVVAFAWHHLHVPEGMMTGERLVLAPFQIAFILAVFDNPESTRLAYLSMARRNGKTFLVAVILLAYIIGPLAEQNTAIASAAMSRDQAGLCFHLMDKMLMLSPDVQNLYRTIPSKKQIIGLNKNVEYMALSADAKTGFGKSLKVILLDEAGQIKGPSSLYTEMLTTSQGSYDDSLMITISTQAPSDADYLSLMLDQAERSNDPHTVSHVYAADKNCKLLTKSQWKKSNPGLGLFRSEKDLCEQLKTAVALPSKEANSRNLLLNQRISQESLFLSPDVWKRNAEPIDLNVFRENTVIAGLDLSSRHDLTACVLAAKDSENFVHVLPFVFCPVTGIVERGHRDRAPYATWVAQGDMIPLGGETVSYSQVARYLKIRLEQLDIVVDSIQYDRWNIENFEAACEREKVFGSCDFIPIGQGYKDFSPRCHSLLNAMLEGKIQHGGHPLLTMSAANAIAISDPSGNVKLDKSKATQRIDPLVAMVMACHPLLDGETDDDLDVANWI